MQRKGNAMGKTVSESIFSGDKTIIPMAEVGHIERCKVGEAVTRDNFDGIMVIMKHSRWDSESDGWANNVYLREDEARGFIRAWCDYRGELEIETLMEMP